MNNICTNATKLVKEAKNKQILAFPNETINEVVEEIKKDYNLLMKLIEEQNPNNDNGVITSEQTLLYEKINRNKRGVLLYLNDRMNKLENITWEYTNDIPLNIEEKLIEADKHYQAEYFNNMKNYYKNLVLDVDMDLTKQFDPPLDSIYASVKSEVNIDSFVLVHGEKNITLEKGCSYVFKKSDVEPYVRKGIFSYNE